MASSFPTINKRAAEERLFDINLAARMRPSDVIREIVSVTPGTGITVDSVSTSGGVVQFRVLGGTAGQRYPIVIQFTTQGDPMQLLEAEVSLVIVHGGDA